MERGEGRGRGEKGEGRRRGRGKKGEGRRGRGEEGGGESVSRTGLMTMGAHGWILS